MFYINRNNIYLTRGDTATIHLSLTTSNGEPYTPTETDTILFTVRRAPKKDSLDSNFLIQKKLINGVIRLESADTGDLNYGKYLYDVEVRYGANEVDTVIVGELMLTEEIS